MKRGAKKTILFSIIGFLIVFSLVFLGTNFYQLFLGCFHVGEDVENHYGRVILVLGGGLRKGLRIGFSTEERLNLAADLYRSKRRRVVVSDGSLYHGSRAVQLIRKFLQSRGVLPEDIYLEGKSQTTLENFVNTRSLISRLGGEGGVIVCTSPYHQLRARMVIRRMGLRGYRIARMVESEIFSPSSMDRRLRNIRLILRETAAVIKYRFLLNTTSGE